MTDPGGVDQQVTDRQRLLDEAREKGFVEGYSGWRVSAEGKRFLVQDAILFNVVSPSEKTVGQAVVFKSWEYEDGSKGSTVPEEEAGDGAAGGVGGGGGGRATRTGPSRRRGARRCGAGPQGEGPWQQRPRSPSCGGDPAGAQKRGGGTRGEVRCSS